eukprot:CAMPEP_0183333226 /NCGR_PEP_ID=MMETSP0164_2-20130417/2176_1 /TAXON_ID=221442 /ORGANISM="Coccolithus pelagicus ssp braarudi, Strain PLY182g" /LENGTH=38 /DNA_ID= /DNA_START= /DNA_END= /DNA_ORIENTATION=
MKASSRFHVAKMLEKISDSDSPSGKKRAEPSGTLSRSL